MFQGEENKVILLSLVRSNAEQKIGFLAVRNRICVAISRAECGLYIFGNSTVYQTSQNWKVRFYSILLLLFFHVYYYAPYPKPCDILTKSVNYESAKTLFLNLFFIKIIFIMQCNDGLLYIMDTYSLCRKL